jgi:predicted amidophosphoribosyltransferase
MTGPKICPHCEQEMDESLAEFYFCSECGQEFDEDDLETAREERREAGEDLDDDEDGDEEDS